MCGEKAARQQLGSSKGGSPPHVRGKGEILVLFRWEIGITPACAGKREGHARFAVNYRDHPRMCGEKVVNVLEMEFKPGSPPHVRGKVNRVGVLQVDEGITPACAGKSTTHKAR